MLHSAVPWLFLTPNLHFLILSPFSPSHPMLLSSGNHQSSLLSVSMSLFQFCLFIYFVLWIKQVGEIMWYLSFSVLWPSEAWQVRGIRVDRKYPWSSWGVGHAFILGWGNHTCCKPCSICMSHAMALVPRPGTHRSTCPFACLSSPPPERSPYLFKY